MYLVHPIVSQLPLRENVRTLSTCHQSVCSSQRLVALPGTYSFNLPAAFPCIKVGLSLSECRFVVVVVVVVELLSKG